jgi:hypothetical protein
MNRQWSVTAMDANETSMANPMARLRESVDTVVGSVFYGALLQTARKSPLKAKYGHGGRGEEVFSAQLDQVLAERAGQARGYSINEALFQHLARQQQRLTPGMRTTAEGT